MARIFLAIYYIHLYSHKLQLQEQEIKKTKKNVHVLHFTVINSTKSRCLFNWNSKVLLKNLLHKGVNFEAQNAVKLTYEHLQFQKNFRGLYPRTPTKRGRGGQRGGAPDSHSWLRHCRNGSNGVLTVCICNLQISRGNKVWRRRSRRTTKFYKILAAPLIRVTLAPFTVLPPPRYCRGCRWLVTPLCATLLISICSLCRGQHADANI